MIQEIKEYDSDTCSKIGIRIQDIRESRHMKAIELASYLGIGKNQMSRIESGKAKEIVELASLKNTNVKFAGKPPTWKIGLKDKSTNTFTTFEKAYYVYNNNKIDVTSVIQESNGVSGIDSDDITQMIGEKFGEFIHSKTGLCVLVKDGVEYSGKVKIGTVN